jgi:hypothetical protein
MRAESHTVGEKDLSTKEEGRLKAIPPAGTESRTRVEISNEYVIASVLRGDQISCALTYLG